MKTIYVVNKNSDQIEGKGRQVPVAHFTTEKVANDYAKSITDKYSIGIEVKPLTVFSTEDEFIHFTKKDDPDYQQYLKLKEKFEK